MLSIKCYDKNYGHLVKLLFLSSIDGEQNLLNGG